VSDRHPAIQRKLVLWVLASLAMYPVLFAANEGAPPAGARAAQATEVLLRGRIVCLAEEMHRLHGTELPAGHPHLFGFRDTAGKFHTLLRTSFSEALFSDPRIQQRELVLKARRLSRSELLDVARFFGIRGDRLEEIFYFCEVCIIREPGPGICPCCQDELELRMELTDQPAPPETG
jgi:hypothetical protein